MTDVQSDTEAAPAAVDPTVAGPGAGPGLAGEEERQIAERAARIASRSKPTRVVAARVSLWLRLGELWRARELFFFLVRKEIKVKYKNSALGFLWSMLNPALTLAVFYVLFTFFLPNGIPNFVIYMFSAMLVWNLFQTAVLTGTSTIVSNAGHREEGGLPPRDPVPRRGRIGLHVLPVPVHRPAGLHDRLLASARLERAVARHPGFGGHRCVLRPHWRSSCRR